MGTDGVSVPVMLVCVAKASVAHRDSLDSRLGSVLMRFAVIKLVLIIHAAN